MMLKGGKNTFFKKLKNRDNCGYEYPRVWILWYSYPPC